MIRLKSPNIYALKIILYLSDDLLKAQNDFESQVVPISDPITVCQNLEIRLGSHAMTQFAHFVQVDLNITY